MSSNTKLFVGNLSHRVTRKDLYRNFETFGEIFRLDLKDNFAFIEYDSNNACREAIRKMHDTDLLGKNIIVELSHSRGPRSTGYGYRGSFRSEFDDRRRDGYDRYEREPRRGGYRSPRDSRRDQSDHYRSHSRNYRLKVVNLPPRVSWQDLKDFARQEIGSSVVRTDVWTAEGGNCGLIEFSDRGDYDYAMRNLPGKRLDGNKLEVARFTRDDEYDRDHSRREMYTREPRRSRRSRSPSSRSPAKRSRSFPKEAEKSSASKSYSRSRSDRSKSSSPEKREERNERGGEEVTKEDERIERGGEEVTKEDERIERGGEEVTKEDERIERGGEEVTKEDERNERGGEEVTKEDERIEGGEEVKTANGIKESETEEGETQKRKREDGEEEADSSKKMKETAQKESTADAST